jgi:hypothetical protein
LLIATLAMSFVIKVSGATGGSGWLSALGEHGVRTIVDRRDAAVFQNRAEAEAVIAQMHSLKRAGIAFSVESD